MSNAKKAKALRKLMKNLISADGSTRLTDDKYVENVGARKMLEVEVPEIEKETGLEIKVKKKVPIAAGTIRCAKDSKRGVYLMLKKELAKVEKNGGVSVKTGKRPPVIQDIERINIVDDKIAEIV